jgi:hypothetical protein
MKESFFVGQPDMEDQFRKTKTETAESDVKEQSSDPVASQPEDKQEDIKNNFVEWLKTQGYSVDMKNAGTVLAALEQVKLTEAYDAMPLSLQEEQSLESSLRALQIESARDLERAGILKGATRHVEWMNKAGQPCSLDDPRSLVEAYDMLNAKNNLDRSYAAPGVEVDNFYDAPVGLEQDMNRLRDLL